MATLDTDNFNGTIGRTYKDSVPHRAGTPPALQDAPNILVIVLDDVGFSDLGCYGSEIQTPRMDALAQGGLKYTNFHVTAMCSPTRACLMTGRNAHSVGVGIIAEWANGFPAYQGRITKKAATMPEILNASGYSSYATGKWHLTHLADYGASGPHGDWPLGRGFARWYGFHGALVDQWNPELYEDNHPINLTPKQDYHLTQDLIDHTISHIRDHVTSAPDRPFFSYLALGACHWPHQVPSAYIDRYRGRYDQGWDAVRAARFARQVQEGIIPKNARMAPRNPGVCAWEDLSLELRQTSSALQETYAAFLEHTDTEIGRLIDYLQSIEQLENTIIVLVSDNGASAEGGSIGAFNMRKHFTHEQETVESMLPKLDLLGSEYAFNHYPMGWAQVSNTPFKWYKKDTHGGGIRAPLIMHWPKGIQARGEMRGQFHHVIDVLPTLVNCAGASVPAMHQGIEQMPVHGVSMRYSFDADTAPSTRATQYFELLGDRAIYHEGWKAVVRHIKGDDYDTERWELYCIDDDYTETQDLSESQPEKLAELIGRWWDEARKFGVLPLDDREAERAHAFLGRNAQVRYEYHANMARIDRLMLPNITDRSYRIVVHLKRVSAGTEGVIFSWGSRFAGFILYARQGMLTYEYIYSENVSYTLQTPLREGDFQVSLDFERSAKDEGDMTLRVDGTAVDTVHLAKTWWNYSMTAGLTCGFAAVPVSENVIAPFDFTAELVRMVVHLEAEKESAAEEKYKAVLREQ